MANNGECIRAKHSEAKKNLKMLIARGLDGKVTLEIKPPVKPHEEKNLRSLIGESEVDINWRGTIVQMAEPSLADKKETLDAQEAIGFEVAEALMGMRGLQTAYVAVQYESINPDGDPHEYYTLVRT